MKLPAETEDKQTYLRMSPKHGHQKIKIPLHNGGPHNMENLWKWERSKNKKNKEPFLLQQHGSLKRAFVRKYVTNKVSKVFENWLATETVKDRTDRQTDMPMDSHFNYYDVSKPGNLAFNCLLTWYQLLFIT